MANWCHDVMDGVLKAGLIGEHIQKTRLPAALELMCQDIGIKLEFQLIDTALRSSFDFDIEVQKLIDLRWNGVTVTHPFKLAARRFAGVGMTKGVSHLNASNTLCFGEQLTAFNTDYTGFLGAWKSNMGDATPGKVVMIGAGGVASAMGPALAELGASQITICDLDFKKAVSLADEIGAVGSAVAVDQVKDAIVAANGLINATAIGMEQYPGSAFDLALLGSQKWAFDAVYTPVNTRFLSAAKDAGLKTFSGFELFKHMAIGSFEAYTGTSPKHENTMHGLQRLKPEN